MSTDVILLQPETGTEAISYHPHNDGDLISDVFVDKATGQKYALVRTPEETNHVATLYATATQSVYIGAKADQIRAAQNDR